MPSRWIGSAQVDLTFLGVNKGRWSYAGSVTVPNSIITIDDDGNGRQRPLVWRFALLESGVGGIPAVKSPESPEAFDAMATIAVLYGSSIGRKDQGTFGVSRRRKSPCDEEAVLRAASIEGATDRATKRDGTFRVKRRKCAS